MIQIKNIVCPIDFFPASLRAFDYALKLAAENDAKLHVLHVVSPALPAAYDFPVDISRLVASLVKTSKRQVLLLKHKAEKARVDIETDVRIGTIDAEILAAIDNAKADLVVMGTHGRHGLERWFMGSVTERMVRRCPAPLLTVPPVPPTKKRSAPRRQTLNGDKGTASQF